jgi:hypothetical protein
VKVTGYRLPTTPEELRVYRLAYLALALALASPASAQVFRIQRDPAAWIGLGVGAFNANDVADGKTNTVWDFGDATTAQYRVSLEKAIRHGSALGITGTYVRAPIIYRGNAVDPASCAACDAHVDLYALYATFHAGGGVGFHQVLDAGAGMMSYQNFRRDSDGAELAPTSPERDFSVIFSYGFGYGLSPRANVNLVQEYGFTIHESEGTSSAASNTLRFATTRLGVRLGFGGRR